MCGAQASNRERTKVGGRSGGLILGWKGELSSLLVAIYYSTSMVRQDFGYTYTYVYKYIRYTKVGGISKKQAQGPLLLDGRVIGRYCYVRRKRLGCCVR